MPWFHRCQLRLSSSIFHRLIFATDCDVDSTSGDEEDECDEDNAVNGAGVRGEGESLTAEVTSEEDQRGRDQRKKCKDR